MLLRTVFAKIFTWDSTLLLARVGVAEEQMCLWVLPQKQGTLVGGLALFLFTLLATESTDLKIRTEPKTESVCSWEPFCVRRRHRVDLQP